MSFSKKEYQKFIETIPTKFKNFSLDDLILSKAQKNIEPSPAHVAIKYFLLFFASIFLSLLICPQFGLGLRNQYSLFHYFFHQNQIFCAVYCASVFFFTTHMLVYSALNPFEKIILYKKLSTLPITIFSISFAGLMFFSKNSTRPDLVFILTWLALCILSYILFNKIQKNLLISNKMTRVS